MPGFLSGIREQAAAFAGIGANDLQQILITEYGPGAAIGWHKDRSVFGDVVGISLLSDRTFRLRRKIGARWQRCNLNVEPRSIYLLRGPLRSEWEHSIPAVELAKILDHVSQRSGSRILALGSHLETCETISTHARHRQDHQLQLHSSLGLWNASRATRY